MSKKIALEFFNRVLCELDMNEIKYLKDFKDIDRKKLIEPEIREIIDEMHPRIKKLNDEARLAYYKRETSKEFNLVYMRALCKGIGMKFSTWRKNVLRKGILTTHTYYSVVLLK
jgi:hypothetical protein